MATTNEEMNEELVEQTEEAAEAVTEEDPEAEIIDPEAKYTEEIAALKDQLRRTMAEYDNFRKRAAKEKAEIRPMVITDVVKEFLPVMDNLARALEAECTDAAYKQGVQMIDDSFMEILTKLGVEEIESDGAMFDPSMHQAVQRVEDSDKESGAIVTTFAKGYKIGDKVIRFSIVSVAN